ncbi:MAG: hypothetical protein LV479_11230 [Methylacidiphilales bacterium]|nr:hypothetical protein [Candidatus Methylacidiphilales bacterium]
MSFVDLTPEALKARNRAGMPLEAANGTAPPNDLTLLSFQGRTADLVWTKSEHEVLVRFLHNGNGDHQFVMALRKEGRGHFFKSRKITVDRAISWAWRTITDDVAPDKRTTFVPYSQNPEGQSRWGCLDFDAHDGDYVRAQRLAFDAWQFLLNSDLTVIIEATGGGWHLWCIAKEFRSVRDWTLFLRGVAKAIVVTVKPGICEVFPDDTGAQHGKGVRAPGSWNPNTDSLNLIFWENTSPLLKNLRSPIGEVKKSSEEHFPDKESNIYGEVVPQYPAWDRGWKDSFRITGKSTRHQQLLGLVGEIFHQVGYSVAVEIIEAHYREARVPMRASQQEHSVEFTAMWKGLHGIWLGELNQTERAKFDHLKSDNERDGFRIIRSFQRKAIDGGTRDFPIARNNFAMRLGVTPKGGGWIRDRLIAAGVVERTAHYVQYRAAARYRWLLIDPVEVPGEGRGHE